ncbi:MAG: hypothetical protein IKK63_07160 [Clostridia bacterium]|nr:hypothetical protein [Clostridia bacterium]
MSEMHKEKVRRKKTAKRSVHNESIGYFIIPFRINPRRYKDFKKHIEYLSVNGKASDKNRFEKCRYLFSSITDIYKNADYFQIDNEKLKSSMENGSDMWDKILPLKALNSKARYDAEVEEISALIPDKSKGYLLFKVNYLDMKLTQIESFTYFFRHIANSTRNNSSFARIACYLLGIEDYENFEQRKNDMTQPFCYLSSTTGYICDVLQLVCRKITDKREEHLACLGRGYQNVGATANNYTNNSNYDIEFSSNKFSIWVGSPNTLTCVLEEDNDFTSHVQANIENDYLCLYLTLQNQRHTLLTYMEDMVNNRNKPHELIKIYQSLNKFKIAESFKTVSNEYAFQNIYEHMYKILDIDKLMEDINDVSANAAEQKSKKIESVFGVFAIVSAIETFYNLFTTSACTGFQSKLRIFSIILSAAVIVFAVARIYLPGIFRKK